MSINWTTIIADKMHDIWARWMVYMFSCGTFNEDGSWTMPKEKVERWQRQARTDYYNLPTGEEKSDRELAAEILVLFGIEE